MSITQVQGGTVAQGVTARPQQAPRSQSSAVPSDTFTPSTPNHTGTYNRMSFVPTNGGNANPGYISSPGLDHNRQVCDQNLSDRPLVGSDGRWNGGTILNAQSQLDTAGSPSASQENRCGPSSLVAGAVMSGPGATARMAERLSAGASPEDSERLQGVRDRLANGTATHGDLSTMQEMAYQRYNTDGSAGMTDTEITAMQRDLAQSVRFDPVGNNTNDAGQRVVPHTGKVVEEPGRTLERVDGLQNGESFTMGTDTNNDGNMNHWVQVGRDDQGRSYVYDPYPAANQAHVSYPSSDGSVGPYERYTEGHYGPVAPGNVVVNPVGGGTVRF